VAGQMRVTPAQVRAAAPTFTAAGEAVGAALAALTGALPAAAGMCGDDEAGQRFRASYEPRVRELTKAMQGLAKGLDSLGPGLVATAGNIEHADGSSVMHSTGR